MQSNESGKTKVLDIDDLIEKVSTLMTEIQTRIAEATEAFNKAMDNAGILNGKIDGLGKALVESLPVNFQNLFKAQKLSRKEIEKYCESMHKIGLKLVAGAVTASAAMYLAPTLVSAVVKILLLIGIFMPPQVITLAPAASILVLGAVLITMSNDLKKCFELNEKLTPERKPKIGEPQTINEAFQELISKFDRIDINFKKITIGDKNKELFKNLGNSLYRALLEGDKATLLKDLNLLNKAGRALIGAVAAGTVLGLNGTVVIKALAVLGLVVPPTALVGVSVAGLALLGTKLLLMEHNFKKLILNTPQVDSSRAPRTPK